MLFAHDRETMNRAPDLWANPFPGCPMRRWPALAPLCPILFVLLGSGAVRGENVARIEPVAGILSNDRVDDVRRKLAASTEIRSLEISLLFHDTVTKNALGS